MGGYVGTWLSKQYQLEGNRLKVTVEAQHQDAADIFYDNDETERDRATLVLSFRISKCPLCRKKIKINK